MSSIKKSSDEDRVQTPPKNTKTNFNSYYSAYITNLPLDVIYQLFRSQKINSKKSFNIMAQLKR